MSRDLSRSTSRELRRRSARSSEERSASSRSTGSLPTPTTMTRPGSSSATTSTGGSPSGRSDVLGRGASGSDDSAGNGELRVARDRLVDDAVALRQTEERVELLVARGCIELEREADRAESDRCVLRDGEGSAKVEIALGPDASSPNLDPDRGSDGLQRDAGAGDERLEEHVSGAEAQAVSPARRVEARLGEC